MNTSTNTAIPQLELTPFAKPRGGFTPREAVEMGGSLTLLKASTLHGEWRQRVELMGFNRSEASRLMKIYAVFKGESNQRLLDAVGVVSKLIELSTLGIDQIETLNAGGEVYGLTLEGLKLISLLEIRKAIREGAEKEHETLRLSAEKIAKINRLQNTASKEQQANVSKSRIDGLLAKWAGVSRISQPRTAVDCVDTGLQLQMLKEVTPEGSLWDRVNALGFNKSAASKYMACARRFDPLRDAAVLTAAGSAVRLTELLSLNDEELAKLGRGAEVRGLTLEELSTMTVMQLRKALGKVAPREGVKLHAEEERLLRNYRKCKPDAKAHIARAAELLAAPT